MAIGHTMTNWGFEFVLCRFIWNKLWRYLRHETHSKSLDSHHENYGIFRFEFFVRVFSSTLFMLLHMKIHNDPPLFGEVQYSVKYVVNGMGKHV